MSIRIINDVVCGPEEQNIPAHLSLGQFLYDRFKAGGNEVALINGITGVTMTYGEILQESVNLAASLQRIGLKKGEVVCISSENRYELIVTSLAVFLCGATVTLFNTIYTLGEMIHQLNLSKPKYIFTSPSSAETLYECSKQLPFMEHLFIFGENKLIVGILYSELVKEQMRIDDFTPEIVNGVEDVATIMYSSGTTGLPKGVMLTHVNILTTIFHVKYYNTLSMQKNKHNIQSCLTYLPLYHAYGFNTTFSFFALHLKVVLLEGFQPKPFLQVIEKYKINMLTLVPPVAVFLAKHALVPEYDLTSLNEVWCGGASLSRELQAAITKRTKISFIKQGFGQTELSLACCVDITNGERCGSIGPPGPGVKIKIIDIETGKKLGPRKEGELLVKTPVRMKGYIGNREATEATIDSDGYVRTGDVGYYDEEGFFYIVDRLKELIKYKGYQVAPAEIEAVLMENSGVAECGVVGKPDEYAGELPLAFVTLQPNAKVTEKELIDHVASKLSSSKHLRGGIIFLKGIPKSATGKILRKELRKILEQELKSKL